MIGGAVNQTGCRREPLRRRPRPVAPAPPRCRAPARTPRLHAPSPTIHGIPASQTVRKLDRLQRQRPPVAPVPLLYLKVALLLRPPALLRIARGATVSRMERARALCNPRLLRGVPVCRISLNLARIRQTLPLPPAPLPMATGEIVSRAACSIGLWFPQRHPAVPVLRR